VIMVRKGWLVELEGVVLSGSSEPGDGCLVAPPEGLGNPPIRTEDVIFPQRDGARHYADWYEPRIVTLEATVSSGDCGTDCPGVREHVRNILQAWSRKCEDVELKVWTDCSDSMDCPDESPGSPGGGPFEWWPLTGTPDTNVTAGNSGLDLVNTGGGTIRYTPDGQAAEFRTSSAGSFTIARGLVAPDHQLSTLFTFRTPGVIPFEQIWDFETADQLADWTSSTVTMSRNTTPPIIAGIADFKWDWVATGSFGKGANADLVTGFVGDGVKQLQVSWSALATAQSNADGWHVLIIDSVADETIAEQIYPVGNTSYTVAVPIPVGRTADRITIYLAQPPEPGSTRIDNVIVRAINTPTLPGEVSIATIRQSASEVAAVRALVMPDRTLQLRDSTGAVLGVLGTLAPADSDTVYQLQIVANSATGAVQAALYGEGGGLINSFVAVGNLTGNTLTGFDIGIVSSNPSMAVVYHDLKAESGRYSPIPPAGVQPPVEDRSLVGPYGIIGRPRQATLTWLRGRTQKARLQLRFDARDHRMFVLDCDGGTGEVCVVAEPNIETTGRAYPRCYADGGMCFDCATGSESGDATATVVGTECASAELCFTGLLTNPVLRNMTTGEEVGLRGEIREGDLPICIDTETGTARQGTAGRTHLITGNPRMKLVPGENILRLISTGVADTGNVTICFRPFVVSA